MQYKQFVDTEFVIESVKKGLQTLDGKIFGKFQADEKKKHDKMFAKKMGLRTSQRMTEFSQELEITECN